MLRTHEGWKKLCLDRGALLLPRKEVLEYHFELTSGKHSNGYVNVGVLFRDPEIADEAAFDMALKLRDSGLDMKAVQYVVGPAMGGITWAHNLARHIKRASAARCVSGECVKALNANQQRIFVFERLPPESGVRVLTADDTHNAGTSLRLMRSAIARHGATALAYHACFFDRSGAEECDGVRIISNVAEPMPIWEAHECPQCQAGSVALRPKGDSWKLLRRLYA